MKVACYNEYGALRKVILCSPQYMEIREVINKTQQFFVNEDINSTLATKQHESLVNALKGKNIDVILLPAIEKFPEQVFTRDIGFTIGHHLFLSKMSREIRQGEEKHLEQQLIEHGISFQSMQTGSIEGGDVLIDRDTIWIGLSGRTTEEAIFELQERLPHYKVNAVPFSNEYLHLDCVFNIISPNEALIFPKAFEKKHLDDLASHYELIEVSEKEQFTLGTNVLSIGNKTVFSLPINKSVNKKLRERGFSVMEVDISEIIKSGGSFRCITLPLVRE